MKTVVTFTGRSVQILCGTASRETIKIEKCITVPFSESCVMNGVVTDPEVFIAGLRAAWQENKLPKRGVSLSLDGNHIRTKHVSAPEKLSPQKTAEMIPFEFMDDTAEREALVYSYVPVEEHEAGRELLAVCAERSYTEEFRTLFRAAGIELSAVYSAWSGFSRLLDFVGELHGQSGFILSIFGDTLVTILVENGIYTSVSMTRLFSERGTPSYGTEIARAVNQLAQMHSTARAERVQTVFCVDFTAADFSAVSEEVSALGFSAVRLDETSGVVLHEGRFSECILHAGVLALGRAGNLLNAGDSEKTKQRDRTLWLILPLLLVTAALCGFTSMLVVQNMALERERDSLRSFVEDPANIAAEAQYNTLIEESAALSRKVQAADEIRAAIESYPRAVSALNNAIAACGGGTVTATVTSYDAASGRLSFSATGRNADGLNSFVQALTETGIFSNVTYSGYVLSGDTYDVNVFCTLSADAGR